MASAITSSVVATLSKAPSAASLAVIQAARAQRVTITEFRNVTHQPNDALYAM